MSVRLLLSIIISGCLFGGCSASKNSGSAKSNINLNPAPAKSKSILDFTIDTLFEGANVGVSVFDPSTGKYLFDRQAQKYFMPASNTKIVTCYEAMHNLPQTLTGIKYYENDTAVYIIPTGDPTLLHPDYLNQPVIDFLQKTKKKIYITDANWKDNELGMGWSWDDYNGYYSAERNALPVYGNVINWKQQKVMGNKTGDEVSISVFSEPEVNWKVRFEAGMPDSVFYVQRDRLANVFHVSQGNEDSASQSVPFIVNGLQSALELLKDTIGKEVTLSNKIDLNAAGIKTILSQPLDSVLKPMMHRSDNFFAEQMLLMVGAEKTGLLNDEKAIDTILKTDLKDLSQKPAWVDGSGLSRFNLFTPRDLVEVLNKMKHEFGMERIKNIFPTGGTGTLSGHYLNENGRLYAKTGSLTNVMGFSGYYYTSGGRLLIFSILINNYTGSTVKARRLFEEFIHSLN